MKEKLTALTFSFSTSLSSMMILTAIVMSSFKLSRQPERQKSDGDFLEDSVAISPFINTCFPLFNCRERDAAWQRTERDKSTQYLCSFRLLSCYSFQVPEKIAVLASKEAETRLRQRKHRERMGRHDWAVIVLSPHHFPLFLSNFCTLNRNSSLQDTAECIQ